MVPPLPKIYLLGNVKNITDYLEREQVNAMLEAAMIANHRDFLLMQVLWRTGVRVSELFNIKPGDIEWNNQVVNITKAKRGKQRRVLLVEETLKMLSDYVLALNTQRINLFSVLQANKSATLSKDTGTRLA